MKNWNYSHKFQLSKNGLIDIFVSKYKKTINQFEQEINSDQKDFSKYDDLIEWKAKKWV